MLRRFLPWIAGGFVALAVAGGLAWGYDQTYAAAASAAPIAQAATATPTATAAKPNRRGETLTAAALVRSTATLTKLAPREVLTELRGGKSLAQIAAAHGSSADAVTQDVVAKAKDRLAKAVQSKRITQQQADARLAAITREAKTLVNDTALGQQAQRHARRAEERGLVRITADLTKQTPQQVVQALRDGKSLAQFAADHGSSGDAIVNTAVNKTQTRLATAVQNGRITQQQADTRLAALRDKLTKAVNRTRTKA